MNLLDEIIALKDDEYAKKVTRFFKTEIGSYSHGDLFLGIKTPVLRNLAKIKIDTKHSVLKQLIKSKYHEVRHFALMVLVEQYKKSKDDNFKNLIFDFYVSNFKYINNWDLVDTSCPHIIGKHLINKNTEQLIEWAQSENLWIKRISIVSTWWFIRNNQFDDTLKISNILINDSHDLIHKAVGWMLREVSKRDCKLVEEFLIKHYSNCPRTLLRYAIEKFPEAKRQKFLKGCF